MTLAETTTRLVLGHISDTHAVAEGEKMHGVIDTRARVEAAVSHLMALAPAPDIVLVTGDCTETGKEAAYVALRRRLDRLACPYVLIPGNHDAREPLREVFRDQAYMPTRGFIQYVIEDLPLRLVALDTTIPERDDGLLCAERLGWLERTLAAAPERPTVILMHHPPFPTGIWWMDVQGLSGAQEFLRIVARHPQVVRVLCGHLHRAIHTSVGRIPVTVAPSTAYYVHLDLVEESAPRVTLEPPACHLHAWTGTELITHTSHVECADPPVDISQDMPEWKSGRAKLRAQYNEIWRRGR
jgi:3',5'-cyclic AMP phosphodiesterase CpdA